MGETPLVVVVEAATIVEPHRNGSLLQAHGETDGVVTAGVVGVVGV